jgi:hypothetical protein
MITISRTIFPDCITRQPGQNGLRIWVQGNPVDPSTAADARAKFQTILGVLRCWIPGAGELRDEQLGGLGAGVTQDQSGNRWVNLGPAVQYEIDENELQQFCTNAVRGIRASVNLANALWLFGRANRTAADFYMVHEYAVMQFHDTKGIRDRLAFPLKLQSRLTKSANNLSPLSGGRHATHGKVSKLMSLQEQANCAGGLLRAWIDQV